MWDPDTDTGEHRGRQVEKCKKSQPTPAREPNDRPASPTFSLSRKRGIWIAARRSSRRTVSGSDDPRGATILTASVLAGSRTFG
jgi:hypothetical protein